MRISDWSSDVCSSDLVMLFLLLFQPLFQRLHHLVPAERLDLFHLLWRQIFLGDGLQPFLGQRGLFAVRVSLQPFENLGEHRSAERRVGKGCVSTGEFRWSP